jgi:hypothetical protein
MLSHLFDCAVEPVFYRRFADVKDFCDVRQLFAVIEIQHKDFEGQIVPFPDKPPYFLNVEAAVLGSVL